MIQNFPALLMKSEISEKVKSMMEKTHILKLSRQESFVTAKLLGAVDSN